MTAEGTEVAAEPLATPPASLGALRISMREQLATAIVQMYQLLKATLAALDVLHCIALHLALAVGQQIAVVA